jgi:molybdate transport system ATP-binding protein
MIDSNSASTDRNMQTRHGLSVRLEQAAPIPLNVSFDCRPGELVALVGPSGSGKSTVLRCIAGLNTPTEGRVACNDVVWLNTDRGLNQPPQNRAVGIVFQSYALFPHLSALENLTVAMHHIPSGQRKTRALQLLQTVNLEGLDKRRPHQLSGGQRQRVALARALAREPSALLLDEPFSSVDQTTRRKLQRELASLRSRMAHPIILVTHDVEEACLLADRVCILHRGQSLDIGSPAKILNSPKHKIAAHLVGLTNVFKGEIIEHQVEREITRLRWLDYELETRHNPRFAAGSTVDWVIPPQHILLHQRVRPSRGERENPVRATIDELVVLGEAASVTLMIDNRSDVTMTFNLPMHVVQRNQLKVRDKISVSLRAEGIHLMPPGVEDAE